MAPSIWCCWHYTTTQKGMVTFQWRGGEEPSVIHMIVLDTILNTDIESGKY